MRKAIVSLGAGPQERLLRLARTTIAPYADRHGYDLHLHTEVLAPERPAPWSKIVALERLQDRYDLLLWLDADLMVVDGRVDIATELEPDRFLYLAQHRTADGLMPNTGVMMLRTGEECAAFLRETWNQTGLIEHRWWENAAVCKLLGYELDPAGPVEKTPWLEATKFISTRWNSIRDAPARQARIRHYPGYSLKTRTAFMLRDLVAVKTLRRRG